MADSTTSVALSIGSQRISMAVFEAAKSGSLILKAYDSEVLTADPGMEAARAAQTRVAIRELVQRLGVTKAKVRYAISGQTVFIRFVRLPPLQEDNLEQLVTFEAQQHVPFPLDEVIWDYELLDGEGEGDKECVIVAIKADALDEINSAVHDAGLGTLEVDVSPMAIYNAFVSSYGKPEETTLLIDIGAKTSNLIYMHGGAFFTRSVAIGGSTITSTIAKEYGISYPEAEEQKTTNGLVALGGGHTEQLDESLAALAMVIRNALSRLPAEIARTTNYYRSQHGGSAPKHIYIAGGGANLPYTLEFFREKLNLPVRFFNPMHNVTIGKAVDAERLQSDGLTLGDLIGLGLRGIGKAAVNIDLVPSAVEQARADEKRRPFMVAAAAVFVAGCAAWAGMQVVAAGKAGDELRTITETRDTLAPYHRQITSLLRKEQSLRDAANRYTQIEAEHSLWIDVINELSGAFASDVLWLVDLEPLHGFNPGPGEAKSTGTSVVRANFPSTAFRASPLANVQLGTPEPAGGARRPQAAPPKPTINAVRVTGFWRDNPRGQNVVSEIVNSIKERSSMFRFTTVDARGKETPLDEKDIITEIQTVAQADGDLAYRFQVILPLAREIAIR
ncbi:MAG: Amuc_1101 family PilM-like pilus complex protein [Luteolibacter sp.]